MLFVLCYDLVELAETQSDIQVNRSSCPLLCSYSLLLSTLSYIHICVIHTWEETQLVFKDIGA